MKRLLAAALAIGFTGCIAHVTPHGTYLEPLVDVFLIGPPSIVVSPGRIEIQPLPPVVVVPDRHVYYYGDAYYYFWGDAWYWGRNKSGPWHPLGREYWPPKMEQRSRDRGPGGGGGGFQRR